MEAFAPLPVDLFADNSLLDEDPYFSLSQFDLELQQQAQAALQQESWQDFDKYLPMDNQLFDSSIRNEEAQPIFMNSTMDYTDPSLLYEPLVEITPQSQQHQQQQSQQPSLQQQQQQQLSSESIMRKQSYPNEWTQQSNINVKHEYASPESLPYSPPQPIANLSSPQTIAQQPVQQQQQQQDIPALQTPSPTLDFDQTISPKTSTSLTPALDFTSATNPIQSTWTSPVTPFESQGKVPIQRLKTNSIITNAVNAALNSNTNYSSTTNPPGRQHKKTAHNAIERRYRNNINDRIAELKNAVPALLYAKVKDNNNRAMSTTGGTKRGHRSQEEDDEDGEDGEEFLDGVAVATKLNKATILRKATEYINHLKKTGDDVKRENMALQNILIQLPGGQDVLNRYQMQKKQREKELHQQQLAEREAQKQQEQKRKQANRKRARYNNGSNDQHHSDAYESSSSSPGGSVGPVTPPAMGSRVFMALFMCITFFSASPLTAGPNSSEQYVNHHHASRTASGAESVVQTSTVQASTTTSTYLNSLFNTDSTWTSLRTILFIVCIFQLFSPYLKTFFFGSSIKLKRVNSKVKRLNNRQVTTATPGELKSREIYTILSQSLIQDGDHMPTGTFSTLIALCRESMQLFSHHVLGYDILYSEQDGMSAQEEWGQVCKWIKLNEIECLGGTSVYSRLSMIYSCFRMINLVDMLDEDKHIDVYASHARAYATAAMQLSLIMPSRFGSFAERLSHYFWENAFVHQYQDQEDATWIQSLDLMENSLEMIDQTRAWSEMMEILEDANHLHNKRLSLSYTAPVLVPVGILSTLYLLENLYVQYDRLITHMMLQDKANDDDEEASSATFVEIMLLLSEESTNAIDNNNNQEGDQRLACWFATVGAAVDAIWKNNTDACEKWLPKLIQRVPRVMTARTSNANHKATLNRLDELTKRAMIHLLMGAVLIKQKEDEEKQKQGLVELESAYVLRMSIRKLTATLPEEDGRESIESTVMTLADFVVSFIGLDAWIEAMKMKHDTIEKRVEVEDRVRELSLSLRRMIGHPSLATLSENQFIVDRLSRLCRYISHHDADSACDLSDSEDELVSLSLSENNEALIIKKAEKAHLILHGLA